MKREARTYHRPLQALGILLEPSQRILLVGGAPNDGANALPAGIVENGAQLVGRRQALGDLELELGPPHRGRLGRVVAGLVLGRRLRGCSRRLAQRCCQPYRGRRARLVEQGDYVKRLVLYFMVFQVGLESANLDTHWPGYEEKWLI